MKLSEINDYVQTGAAIVAIVGIFLLGYELRQANDFATQQAVSQSWSTWVDWQGSYIESDIATLIAKAYEHPESLSRADKAKLHEYYLGAIYLYESDFEVFSYTGEQVFEAMKAEAVFTLSGVFSYPYAKAWFFEFGYDFRVPGMTERIKQRLLRQPNDMFAQFDSRVLARMADFEIDDTKQNQREKE